MVGDVTTERSDARQERWLLRDGGTAVGASRLHLPQLDNTDNAELLLVVHPAYRRRGAGRTLLAHAADRARSQGRRRLVGEVFAPLSGSAPGPGFAEAVGAARALDELCRALRLDELDEARLTALDAEARSRAAGYDLVQWVGAAPAELVDDFAVLLGRMSTDAPLG
ncbi:MAG: GNAT family N-acetyltransferase, partial [Actinomycetes bacterium]